MKRLLTIGLMLVSAFAFTNCAEQLDSPTMESDTIVESTDDVLLDTDYSYLVYLDEAETKTYYESGKIYWADKEAADANGIEVDYIHLFSSESSSNNYTYHHAFEYVGDMSFAGDLNLEENEELPELNDWYCIYPHLTPGSSSESTITAVPVTLGAESVIQERNGSKSHLVGKTCPLYGIKNRVPKNKNPKFNKMSHMVAVVALNIVNNGHGGDIVVKSAGLTAAEEIVGDFDVNILGNPSKNIYDPIFTKKTNAKKSTKVELSSAVAIKYGESATLYLAVKPFDASGKELTISINGDAKKGNGASKTITMPAGSKFEAGKITTITVPVEKLSFHYENVDPATSNVMNVKSTGMVQEGKYVKRWVTTTANTVTLGNSTSETMVINGKNVSAYVIGSENAVGTVTIKGKAKELIPYVPIEFYASSWNGEKAVMRVEKITAWYYFLLAYVELSFDYAKLTQYMAASRITFSGLVPLEQAIYNGKKHLTILDEEPYHKRVSKEQIEALMQNFDDDKTDDANGFKPTYDGLYAAITNPSSLPNDKSTTLSQMKSEADITAKIIFDKIFEKLGDGSLGDFAGIIFTSPKAMFETVADMPIQVTLSTVAKGGGEGATDNRIVVWGLNSPNAK